MAQRALQTQAPSLLGASLFSASDAHARLRAFAAAQHRTRRSRPLFFAKADVSACFDSVPQAKLLKVVAALLRTQAYTVEQHAVVKTQAGAAPRVRFFAKGRAAEEQIPAAGGGAAAGAGGGRVLVGPLGRQSAAASRCSRVWRRTCARTSCASARSSSCSGAASRRGRWCRACW